VPTTANPGPMVRLLSDGKGAGSIDRAMIKNEYPTLIRGRGTAGGTGDFKTT